MEFSNMKPEQYFNQNGAISNDKDDRYGFTSVADGLAESILRITDEEGTVIGLEGRWGSGKTSLLNLLLKRLEAQSIDGMHVIPFSPWLNGAGNLTEALLLPVAMLLREEEERLESPPHGVYQHTSKKIRNLYRWVNRKRNEGVTLQFLNYIQQTSGRLASITDFAGNFFPDQHLSLASKSMDALAKADLSTRSKTVTELRSDIESRLKRLNKTFVIIIDDLDRLEPSQAIEVLRLVRSVANFPRFRYVMCYDRDVLAHAVEQGLSISNGRLYLQKIVPLSFSVPHPESFAMRRHFRDEAILLYRKVSGADPDVETEAALSRAVDIYGEALATPREVTQVLSSISFRYPGLKDYVWFPDLCMLQLIRETNPTLYDWAEHYLTERAVEVSEDATLLDNEKQEMTTLLKIALEQFSTHAARSPWELGGWLPGITADTEEKAKAFGYWSIADEEGATARRRLASPVYWRYYFAFSSPANVLTENEIQEILKLAAENPHALQKRLFDYLTDNGVSTRTWFEHILTRLTPAVTLQAEMKAKKGLLSFIFNYADQVNNYFRSREREVWISRIGIEELVNQLLQQLLTEERQATLVYLQEQFSHGCALEWSAKYMDKLLMVHGGGGYYGVAEENKMFLTPDEMELLRNVIDKRMQLPEVQSDILKMSYTGQYLKAWRNIAGPEVVKNWVTGFCQSDETFLQLLLNLRHSISYNGERLLALNLGRVADTIAENSELFSVRLNDISNRATPNTLHLLKEVRKAIENDADF